LSRRCRCRFLLHRFFDHDYDNDNDNDNDNDKECTGR